MANNSLANAWIKAQGAKWSDPRHGAKKPMKGKNAKNASSLQRRKMRGAALGQFKIKYKTVKAFVEAVRSEKCDDCIFVPYAMDGRPSTVMHCDSIISAARYMALLTFGTPPDETDMVRHLCGNGHLSCVNPGHLRWGDASDNMSDAVRHRAHDNVQDKINAVTRD